MATNQGVVGSIPASRTIFLLMHQQPRGSISGLFSFVRGLPETHVLVVSFVLRGKLGERLFRRLNRLNRKPSINHALARSVGTDVRGVVYGEPSSMFQGSSAS